MGRSISVVLLGLVLVVAGLIAQESQPQVNGTPQRHINSIELTRVSRKPVSFKGSAEMVQNPENGKLVRLRTEAMWARDNKGRIYYDTRSPVPAESDQTPQIVGTVVIDPSAGTFTACWPSLHTCYVSKLNPARRSFL